MGDIVAVVVGIEQYAYPGWNVEAPYRNALEVVRKLLRMGVDGKNIGLFINRDRARNGQDDLGLAALKAEEKIEVFEPTKANILDHLARMPIGRSPNSKLFLYWCGHGYSNQENHRILVCEDFGKGAFNDRVLNATSRFRNFGSSDNYSCFSEQIFLADVCAKYTDDIELDQVRAGGQMIARQVALFATQNGGYSTGGFSDVAVNWLNGQEKWPALEGVLKELVPQFEHADVKPFLLDAFDSSKEIQGVRFGKLARTGWLPRVHELFRQLSMTSFNNDELRKQYRATATNLKLQPIPGRVDLFQAISHLADLVDAEFSEGLTHGMLQFAVRLSREHRGKALESWLTKLPPNFNQALSSIDEILKEEEADQILIVEVDAGLDEQLNKVSAFMCSRSGKLLSFGPFSKRVRDWNDICLAVNAALDELEHNQKAQVSEIQFVIQALFFHFEFHRIRRGRNDLGEIYVVVVREKTRAYKRLISPDWRRFKDAVEHCGPAQVKTIEVPADITKLAGLFDSGEGICYAGFICGPSEYNQDQRDLLHRLILRGVAYAFWLQRTPGGAQDWKTELRKFLVDRLRDCAPAEFPQEMLRRRALSDPYAIDGTILWDDPDFKPFVLLRSPA
jgi:hypothetical protein